MRKAQAVVEYATVLAMIMMIIVPTSYLFYSYSHQSSEQLKLAQADIIGRELVSAAEQVYFMGAPAKIVLEQRMPDNVLGMSVNFDEAKSYYELVMQIKTDTGTSELSFPSDTPLNIFAGPEVYTPGIKKIIVEASEVEGTTDTISVIKMSDVVGEGGTPELCDGIDNDLDGFVDEGCDDDNDDYCDASMIRAEPYSCSGTNNCCAKGGDDCNDNNENIYPGTIEICDGIDNNCDGTIDENCDDDNDDYCDSSMTRAEPYSCEAGANCCSLGGNDCDDEDPLMNPGAEELCDNIDNNCGFVDEGCDSDNDYYCNSSMTCIGLPSMCPVNGCTDCDESDATINPAATEICDGVDNNCDGTIDEGCYCVDGTPMGQCSDTKPGYCNEQMQLVDDCQQCGCPSEGICQGTGIYAGKCLRTQVFSPHADAYVDEGYPDSTYGYSIDMYSGGNMRRTYKKVRSYFRFCNLPTKVVEATLNIYSYPVISISADDFSIVGIGCIWYEYPVLLYGVVIPGITWNNQPLNYGCAGLTKTVSYSLFMSSGWKNIDITEIVQQPYIDQDSFTQNCANMVLLGDSNDGVVSIFSKQATGYPRPYLEIKYLVP